jgi:geranyl-CoA carboxylase alpha subunit
VTRTLHVAVIDDAVAGIALVDVALADRSWRVRLHPVDDDGWRAIDVDGRRRRQLVLNEADRVHVVRDAAVHVFTEPSPFPQPEAAAAARIARAPVAGVVAQVAVQPGQRVVAGQPLVCVEAMKMEMWLHAAAAGRVGVVRVAPRDTVASGAVLVELDLDGEASRATGNP